MAAPRHLEQAVRALREGASLRAVVHARIGAASHEDAHRARFALEDALNTADFGDCGRLIVVRTLSLGRLPAAAPGWAVARAMEHAWRRVASHAVPFSSAEAGQAPAVYFASAAEARTAYIHAVVHGKAVDAWFWPRAVPELDRLMGAANAVVEVLAAMAPEDAGVLAQDVGRWEAHALDVLAALLPVAPSGMLRGRLEALAFSSEEPPVAADGAPMACSQAPRAAPSRADNAVANAARALRARGRTMASQPGDWRVTWVNALLLRCVLGYAPTRAVAGEAGGAPVRTHGVLAGHVPAVDAVMLLVPLECLSPPTPVVHAQSPSRGASAPRPTPGVGPPRRVAAGQAVQQTHAELAVREVATAETAPCAQAPWLGAAQPTAFAGLPMLLSVLDALAIEPWLEAQEPAVTKVFARVFLEHIADRLRVPEGDGIRVPLMLTAEESAAFEAGSTRWAGFAWPAWSDAWLPQGPRLCARSSLVPWRVAVRRTLRLHAGLGIESLCRRTGLVATTATHVDVTLPLEVADLRVRRRGLDCDPGWVPWFGRIVAFHYADANVLARGTAHA